jgi:clan AA aspartic protease (TIGR02281 family)
MKKIIFTCTILLLSVLLLKAQVRIAMEKNGGVYTTPCTVNGLQLRFVFDTGASNVSISLSEAVFMLKNGYLDEEDLHGSSYSQIANGELVENTTINIKELKIGGIKLQNVEAIVIHELSAPLLLGQSAIQRLGPIQIKDDELIIMNADSPTSIRVACLNAINLVIKAKEYYFDELYALSADTYQKAYDICPGVMDCWAGQLFGRSYYYIGNYSLAIKYLGYTINCETDSFRLYYIYSLIGNSYMEIKDFDKAIINAQKAIVYASEDIDKFFCYSQLADIHSEQKKYDKSIKYAELGIEYYLKHLSTNVNDIMQGKVKDKLLGESFYNISNTYFRLKQESKSDNYMIKSALCGYEDAIEYCNKYDLKYELYIE